VKTYTKRVSCRVCAGSGKDMGWTCGNCRGAGSYLTLMFGVAPKVQRDLFDEGGPST
jgi:DnaJ-class molecular chaperone